MKCYALVDSEFEQLAQQEIQELIAVKASNLSFNATVEKLAYLFRFNHSLRRLLVAVGEYNSFDKINFDFNWSDFFTKDLTFKIEVENVKGQENRLELARKIVLNLTKDMQKKLGFTPKIEIKKPDVLIIVYCTGEKYLLGIDLSGEELNNREYRLFPHAASFKGDMAYYFVRELGFQPGEKLLCALMKDGAITLEAILFANKIKAREIDALQKFPLFNNVKFKEGKKGRYKIYAFDEGMQNVMAARKNAKIAQVEELCEINKFSLEDVDVKYSQNYFDKVVIQVTRKDEDKLNEICYQFSYVLKKKGRLLIIGRKNWEVSVSDKFKLIRKTDVRRGDSIHRCWLLEKR